MEKKINLDDLLRKEALLILNDVSNYSKETNLREQSRCKLCKKEIEEPYIPLILWDEGREYYISFHLDCAIKLEKESEFLELANTFNYIYMKIHDNGNTPECPRCGMVCVDLGDTIECTSCKLEFEKRDLQQFDKSDVLAIQEKNEIVEALEEDRQDLS